MTMTNVLVGVAIAIGLAGIVVPILPGTLLILGALVVWALEVQEASGWVVLGIASAFLVGGAVLKFLVPGKRLKASVPTSTLWYGALGALVGFFVIPVVGALAGFPLGVYLAERRRLGAASAWPSTKAALKAVGLSMLIEFVAGVAAGLTWLVGVLFLV